MHSVHRRSCRLARVLALLVVLGSAVGPGSPVRAANTYYANVLSDAFSAAVTDCATSSNGDCTLREAIAAANANPGADIVTLVNGATYTLTINPVSADDNTTGDLNITESVSIVVASGGTAIIDASGMVPTRDRVLTLVAGTVSITNVTLRNGSTSGAGGGILNNGTLILTNCTVSGSAAGTTGGGISNTGPGQLTVDHSVIGGTGTSINTAGTSGGGIANAGGTGIVTVRNSSQIVGNRANGTTPMTAGGGGIFNATGGQVTISASAIRENTTGGAGGGIFSTGSGNQVTITGSTIANNQSDDGGGIRNVTGTAQVTDTIILGNTLTHNNTGFGNGGGISNDGTLTLTRTTVSGNSAAAAAGGVGNGVGSVTLQDSTITGNTATFGGGIQNFFSGRIITLTNTTVSANQATAGDGGGIRNLGTLNVTDSIISGNTASGNSPLGNAGGIANDSTVTLTRTTVSGNTATTAGGGIGNGIDSTGTLTLQGSTVSGNTASFGGGIQNFFAGDTVTLTNSTVSGNHATVGNGGGVRNFGTLNATNSTFSGNTASSGLGGGITYLGTVTLNNVTIVGNSTGINNSGGSLTMKNTLVGNNPGGDCTGSVPSTDYNLASDATCTGFIGVHDRTGANPLVAPLGAYGGLTQTHAVLPGSPALDAGDDATCAGAAGGLDQRGISRSASGVHCDIGAFESQGFVLTLTGGSGQSAVVGGVFSAPLAVRATSAFEPVAGGAVTFTTPASGASAALASNPATIAANGGVSVTATANNIVGTYTISAGAASVTFNLTNLPALTAVNPTAGGTAGGTRVTLTGAGFGTTANTQVLVDGVAVPLASMVSVTATQIVYLAPAHGAGNATITVMMNGVTSAGQTYLYATLNPLPSPKPGNPNGSPPAPLPNARPAGSAAAGSPPAPLPQPRP